MPPMAALDAPPWRWSFGALALALLAQATVLNLLHVHGGALSVVLLVTVWFAARAGVWRGALFALIAGACEDAVAGNTGAGWTFATPIAAVLGGRIVRAVDSDNPLLFGAVVALAALVRLLAFRLILQAQDPGAGFDGAGLHAALWSAALDGVVASIVLIVVPRLRPLRVDLR
jgi:rod shape-determining protein MreD